MDHKNAVINLIKSAIKSDKFPVNKSNNHQGIIFLGHNNNNNPSNSIVATYNDAPTTFTDNVTSFCGSVFPIEPGPTYDDYQLTLCIHFEDKTIPSIYLSRGVIKFERNERKVEFLDYIKSIFGIKKAVASSIDIDFEKNLGMLTIGDTQYYLNVREYNDLAKELIQELESRKKADSELEISKLENYTKNL